MTHLTLMGLTGPAAGGYPGVRGGGSKLLPMPFAARFATAHLFQMARNKTSEAMEAIFQLSGERLKNVLSTSPDFSLGPKAMSYELVE